MRAAGPRWERVQIVSRGVHTNSRDGWVDLADGRRLVVPADTRDAKDSISPQTDFRRRWKNMDRALDRGRRPRVIVENGRMVAIGINDVLVHPVELAVMAGLGLDVDTALAAWFAMTTWTAPGTTMDAPPPPETFYTSVPGSRLSAHVDVAEGVTWSDGILTVTQTFPEGVRAAAIGRPLREVVSIAGLDHLDLPILRADHRDSAFNGPSWTEFQVVPDDGWTPLFD